MDAAHSKNTVSIRQLWIALSLVYWLLIVHFAHYRFVQQHCTQTLCGLLASTQIVAAVIVTGVAMSYRQAAVTGLREMLGRVPTMVTWMVLGGILLGFGLVMRGEWLYVHIAVALAGAAALYVQTVYGERMPHVLTRTAPLWLACMMVIIILLRIAALAVLPSIQIVDEPWTLGWAVSYLRTGQPSDWIMGSVSGVPYYSLPRYYALVAAWLQVVGVGLWEGRLFSLLLLLLMLLLTTLAARNLFDAPTAALTFVALLGSSIAVIGLRLRHDIGVGLALAASLWVYSLARQRDDRLALHGLAGLLLGMGMAAHYHTIGFSGAALIGLYAGDYIARLRARRFLPPAPMIAYGVGLLVSGVTIFGLQTLPDLTQFNTYLSPRSPRDLQMFVESFIYHIREAAQHSYLEFALLAVALVAALWRSDNRDRVLAVTLVFSFVALGGMAGWVYGPFDYYAVPLVPLVALLIGRFFASGQNRVVNLRFVVGLGLLVIQLGYSASDALTYVGAGGVMRPPPPPAAAWVLDNVPQDSVVVAENYYFLWLHDYPFLSPLTPTYLPPAERVTLDQPGATAAWEAAWRRLDPDVIIFDRTLATTGMLDPLIGTALLDAFTPVYKQEAEGSAQITIYRR